MDLKRPTVKRRTNGVESRMPSSKQGVRSKSLRREGGPHPSILEHVAIAVVVFVVAHDKQEGDDARTADFDALGVRNQSRRLSAVKMTYQSL